MGQKVNPKSFRMINTKQWLSRWFDPKNMAKNIIDDIRTRETIWQKLGAQAGIGRVEIERDKTHVRILIYTAKPGIIIGRSGKGIEELRNLLTKKFGLGLKLEVIEIKKPDADAMVVAQSIGYQIEKRINYRRAAKQAIDKAMSSGAKGIKIIISGRLRGAEIAREEKFTDGLVPLANLRSDIDFAIYHARTSYGVIGVKIWIYKGPIPAKEEINVNAA